MVSTTTPTISASSGTASAGSAATATPAPQLPVQTPVASTGSTTADAASLASTPNTLADPLVVLPLYVGFLIAGYLSVRARLSHSLAGTEAERRNALIALVAFAIAALGLLGALIFSTR
jgi:hypothetical protein